VWVTSALVLCVGVTAASWPSSAAAQTASTLSYEGYAARTTPNQQRFEQSLQTIIDTGHARRLSQALSAEPHVAGTPRQRWTARYVDSLARSWGIESRIDSFLVFLPHPKALSLERVNPDPRPLTISERRLDVDPATHGSIFPAFNGYSGRGDVTGEVVYVNYGLIEDYERLEAHGVEVSGKIAVARYGGSFRGIKAREAERHGAIGLLMYSDPADDGYVRGDVYPGGPFRPEFGVQRGSIKNGRGDPSTPSWPSTFDAARVPENEMIGMARIPVLPVSYGTAAELLRYLDGAELPDQSWQGGLPFRYHVGPGPAAARLAVDTERGAQALHPIYNTLAVLPGATHPDEWVVVGAHRDAWGPGATDNVSGTTSVLEMARAFARLAAQGRPPRRTIIFATWDAEEWGLIGSWEWVEQHQTELQAKVVAYINQDAVASGQRFGASAAGVLKQVLREITRVVHDPFGDLISLHDRWRIQHRDTPGELPVGDLGGGSDFAGFYNLLGIPAANLGFGGEGGVYHSAYDSYRWMSRYGDPSYAAHVGAARATGVLVARIANADILPYDHADLALHVIDLIETLHTELRASGWDVKVEPLRDAALDLGQTAAEFAVARDSALAALPTARFDHVNRALLSVDKALTRNDGLVGRPWMRNLLFAADRDNGYGNMPLPSVREAVRDGDVGRTHNEITDLTRRIRQADAALRDALIALRRNQHEMP
jgi:N-acetylated-alpha-linked acidic dipeptidase